MPAMKMKTDEFDRAIYESMILLTVVNEKEGDDSPTI